MGEHDTPLHKDLWYWVRGMARCWWICARADYWDSADPPWWTRLLAALVQGPAFALFQGAATPYLRGWPKWIPRAMTVPELLLNRHEFGWWLESHVYGERYIPPGTPTWTGDADECPYEPVDVYVPTERYDPDNRPQVWMKQWESEPVPPSEQGLVVNG